MSETAQPWHKGAVIYQIYPRSFYDSTGDGTGDLNGITQKMDYIADLGVDGVWICPFYPSPMKDFGYDVSNYRDVDPLFGTLDDFDGLVKEAHAKGLKVIIDLVLSHTSDQHSWFKDPAKKEYYVWADQHNNWVSVFGGSAWEYDERYGQYYLHNFLKEQPDLNFHNPAVQQEAFDIARFWLERGVDGFRLDVINFCFHDPELRDNPPSTNNASATQFEGEDEYSKQTHIYDKSRPENIEFIKKFRALLDEYGAFAVGEIGDDHPVERAAEYTAPGLLHTAYNLQMMGGQKKSLTPALIRDPIEQARQHPKSWPSWAFSNHDVVRAISRWDADPKMLIALLGSLYGTLFLYQGEELGLTESELKFEDLQDPWGKKLWPQWQGRDGCRTPIPWTDQKPEKSWLPMPDSHIESNISNQIQAIDSILNFTRKFLKWRAGEPVMKYGDITFHDADDQILSFDRTCEGKAVSCRFNLSPPFDFQIEGFDLES